MFELHGKIALVTGGGGARVGTGAGIARTVARQGAYVIVNDRNAEAADQTVAAIEADGGQAVARVFDVRDADAVDAAVEAMVADIGPIDILVNSAGGGSIVPFRDMAPGLWARIVDLNLFGVVNCTRAVIDPMCERGWGRVVTIASSAAFMGSSRGLTAYGASKAGVVGFTHHLAMEVGPFGVTANCIAPGLVRGDSPTEEEILAATEGRTGAVGRVGTPADVGALCVFLASEEASWLTGQTVHLNGGAYTT